MQQTARAAVLTAPKKFEIREYPIPAIGDDEMLIKVEACGVCGTDGHEYNRDPFGLCPVVLGHEGTGEIVAMGKNITKDTAGNPLALGDKIVTCIIPCGTCDACLNTPARTNLCENVGVYGLMPDDDVHLNGYFGEYLVIRKGSTFFNVSGMTLDQRILVEPAARGGPFPGTRQVHRTAQVQFRSACAGLRPHRPAPDRRAAHAGH